MSAVLDTSCDFILACLGLDPANPLALYEAKMALDEILRARPRPDPWAFAARAWLMSHSVAVLADDGQPTELRALPDDVK